MVDATPTISATASEIKTPISKDLVSLNNFLEKYKLTKRYTPSIPIATNPLDIFRSLNNSLAKVSIINDKSKNVVLKKENKFLDIRTPLILQV